MTKKKKSVSWTGLHFSRPDEFVDRAYLLNVTQKRAIVIATPTLLRFLNNVVSTYSSRQQNHENNT